MIRLLTAVLLSASFPALAQTNVPNDLTDGEVASAEEVMQNFQALEDVIDSNADALPEIYAGPCTPNERLLIWDSELERYTCGNVRLWSLNCDDGVESCSYYCPEGDIYLSGSCSFGGIGNAFTTFDYPIYPNGHACSITPSGALAVSVTVVSVTCLESAGR